MRVRGRVGREWDRGELIGRPHMAKEETWGNPSSNIDASLFYVVLAPSVNNRMCKTL